MRDGLRGRGQRFAGEDISCWSAIEVLLVTGVTNVYTTIKVKCTGRGYRNPEHYRAAIHLTSAARRAA